MISTSVKIIKKSGILEHGAKSMGMGLRAKS